VFGDVQPDEAIAAVARSFGAIPPRTDAGATPPPVTFPAHDTTPVVRRHKGPANQAVALIAWPTGAGTADFAESRRLDILGLVFSDRLFERMRQAAGASYSPGVSSQWPKGLPGGGRLLAMSQVSPANVPLFFKMAREIAADLATKPVTQDELDRVKGPLIQQIQRAASSSLFWMQQMTGGTYDPSRIAVLRQIGGDYGGVTPEILQQTAAKYLVEGKDWTMTVLPEEGAK
jgi:zinc protease